MKVDRFNYRKFERKIFISVSKKNYCRRLHEGAQLDPLLHYRLLLTSLLYRHLLPSKKLGERTSLLRLQVLVILSTKSSYLLIYLNLTAATCPT